MSKKILVPKQAVKIAKTLIQDEFKEHLIAIYLNSYNKIIKTKLISLGSMTASIVHPREIFRPSLVNRATAVIILHNHPSGELNPSFADEQITKLLMVAGQILGIKLIDHIIFNSNGEFYSFWEEDNCFSLENNLQ